MRRSYLLPITVVAVGVVVWCLAVSWLTSTFLSDDASIAASAVLGAPAGVLGVLVILEWGDRR